MMAQGFEAEVLGMNVWEQDLCRIAIERVCSAGC